MNTRTIASKRERLSVLQLVIFAILAAVLPLVITDYVAAQRELQEAKAVNQQLVQREIGLVR